MGLGSFDPLSLSSLQIDVYFNDTCLSTATGFIIEKRSKFYLVTNWHVVTGRDQTNGSLLDEGNASLPNKVTIKNNLRNFSLSIPLYYSDDIVPDKKKWLEYPKGKKISGVYVPTVDVILLPINNEELPNEIIFDLTLANHDMIVETATPVSIIGFPFGKNENSKLPIWTTGFVGSEPTYNVRDLPLLYVNANTYKGLSGSPVIVKLRGSYMSNSGLNIDPGYHKKFIGIYSGRIFTADENNTLSLCNVWKAEVIDEILFPKL